MSWHLSTHSGHSEPLVRDEVAHLVAVCEAHDGAGPIGDDNLLGASQTAGEVIVRAGPTDALVGYAVVAGATAELAVHPDHRNTGIGRALCREAVGLGATSAWAHGDLSGARRLAAEFHATPQRELQILTVSASDIATTADGIGSGFRIRHYAGSTDDRALLAVNRAAFVDLPDQGSWTSADLAARTSAAWFRPHDLLLLISTEPVDGADIATTDGALAGFHWTKVHASGACEVYVVALHPLFQGRGLSPGLIGAGLVHLLAKSCAAVMLYVDANNEAALAVYRRLGFTLSRRDILYAEQ